MSVLGDLGGEYHYDNVGSRARLSQAADLCVDEIYNFPDALLLFFHLDDAVDLARLDGAVPTVVESKLTAEGRILVEADEVTVENFFEAQGCGRNVCFRVQQRRPAG